MVGEILGVLRHFFLLAVHFLYPDNEYHVAAVRQGAVRIFRNTNLAPSLPQVIKCNK